MCPFVCILLFASSLIGRALQKTTDTLQSSVEIYTLSYKPPVPYPVPDNWSQMALWQIFWSLMLLHHINNSSFIHPMKQQRIQTTF